MCKGANLVARKIMARIDVFPLMLLSPHVLNTVTVVAAKMHSSILKDMISSEMAPSQVISMVSLTFRSRLCISIGDKILVVQTWEKAIRGSKVGVEVEDCPYLSPQNPTNR